MHTSAPSFLQGFNTLSLAYAAAKSSGAAGQYQAKAQSPFTAKATFVVAFQTYYANACAAVVFFASAPAFLALVA
jgi:hypothetical protein